MTESSPSSAYEELVAAIVKAVPEIADWVTIGTELRLDGYKHIVTSCCGEDGELGSFTTVQQMHRDELGKHFEWEADELEKFEVIIRPITLEDVLLALGDTHWHVGSWGRFYAWSRTLGEMVGQPVSWNLGKPLSEQSPETIAFLHSIICK